MRNLLLVTVGIALGMLLVLRSVATAEGPPGEGPQTTEGGVLANPGTAFTYQGRLTDGGANPHSQLRLPVQALRRPQQRQPGRLHPGRHGARHQRPLRH